MKRTYRVLPSVVERRTNDRVGLVAFVEEFMSPEECQRTLALASLLPQRAGLTGVQGKQDQARASRVRFINPAAASEWLFAKLEGALLRLNEGYGFDLQGFFDGAQIAQYTPGGHYDWHMDLGQGVNSTRKLSMSVQLTPPEDYDGGELEFLATDELSPRRQGALIVFPSFLVHRVRPVTRGERWSLVSWISGPPFR